MIFWFTLGMIFVMYYLLLKINQKNVSFSKVFLIIGLLIIALSFFFESLPNIIKNIIWLMTVVFIVGLTLFLVQCLRYSKKDLPSKIDVIFIFGAGLFGSRISLSLQKRLDKAIELAYLYPNATMIVSGGQGRNEDVSEAFAMSEYLINHHINKKRIFLEDKSTSTYENLSFSLRLYDLKNKKVALVTNQFHVFRACLIAKNLGINGYGVSGRITTIALPVFYLREFLASIKGIIKKEL